MTQLIIAGVETVLPQNFSVTVKRENSFFTKNGEYTYDCTLRLDNRVNQQLYGFLHRLNKTGQIDTRRTAILMADGHVYCRGTEVVTKWTDQTVSIQIVSGESELNYFVGQEQKIEDLDGYNGMGWLRKAVTANMPSMTFPVEEFCLATVRNESGRYINFWQMDPGDQAPTPRNPIAQPYLCAILRRMFSALGYTVTENQLENSEFKNLFLVNTVNTTHFAKMLPGWTVKDFLTEVERLCGVVFITDNTNPQNLTVKIVRKAVFYAEARQYPLSNVVDTYEAEAAGEDGGEPEFTGSDVEYELPEHRWAKLMQLPDDIRSTAYYHEYPDFATLLAAAESTLSTASVILRDTSTGRCYIRMHRTRYVSEEQMEDVYYLLEVDQFKKLERENVSSTLSLKITPAPMAFLGTGCEYIDLGDENSQSASQEGATEPEEAKDYEDVIRNYSQQESKTVNLYCAFHCGAIRSGGYGPIPYTDAVHASMQPNLYPNAWTGAGQYNYILSNGGSLRLADLDADYYQGGYQIDTAHAITFETFDPNHIDVRQVYVIGNKRYVVRDVEETITAEGRQPMWRVTCYPITISDEAIENRWILTRGIWDDGGAWLDDGRWNDTLPAN